MQKPLVFAPPLIRRSVDRPPRDLNVRPDVGDERLDGDVVVLGPDEAKDHEREVGAVEVGGEWGENVDFLDWWVSLEYMYIGMLMCM